MISHVLEKSCMVNQHILKKIQILIFLAFVIFEGKTRPSLIILVLFFNSFVESLQMCELRVIF